MYATNRELIAALRKDSAALLARAERAEAALRDIAGMAEQYADSEPAYQLIQDVRDAARAALAEAGESA